jgi:hypothetical protein
VTLFHHSPGTFAVVGVPLIQYVSSGIRPSRGMPDNTRSVMLHVLDKFEFLV